MEYIQTAYTSRCARRQVMKLRISLFSSLFTTRHNYPPQIDQRDRPHFFIASVCSGFTSAGFPLFQKGSTSNESTSAVTKPSSPGNSTSTTSITIGAECGWDIAGPDTPLFGTACTWNCETTKSTSPPIPFRGSAQLRDDEDGSPASIVPAVLGSCKSEPVLDGDLLSWCSNPQLLEGASGSKENEDDEELSRFFDSLYNTRCAKVQ